MKAFERVKEFVLSLFSRKFLLAAAAIAGFLSAKQYPEAVAALVAYLGVEGAADVVTRKVTAAAEAYQKARENR